MITLSIDVTKLDKTRFKHVTKKNGDKAVYCELVLFDSRNTEYGDYMVKQGLSKEDREKKVEMPILGNGKKYSPGASREQAAKPEPVGEKPEQDDIPF